MANIRFVCFSFSNFEDIILIFIISLSFSRQMSDIRPRPLPSTSIPIHYPPNTLPFDTASSELLTFSPNKLWIYHVQTLFLFFNVSPSFKKCVTSVKNHYNTLVLLSGCHSIETWADGPENVQSKAAWNIK
jgi:hypothetical protein